MDLVTALLIAFLALLSRTPSITFELGSLADWISGLGSLAAVAVALNGFRIVEKHRASDRDNATAARAAAATDADKAVAYELTAALSNMSNNLIAIRTHVAAEARDVVIRMGDTVKATYQSMPPLVGLSEEGNITLPLGTTQLLIKANAVDFWNDVMLLANSNRAITSIMKQYHLIYEDYLANLPPPESFTGDVGHMSGSEDQLKRVEASLVRIGSVVSSLRQQVTTTNRLQARVTGQLGPIMTRYFGESFLHFREEDPTAAAPQKK